MAIVLGIIAAYLLMGTLFALAFVARGAGAIDPVATSAPLRVRLLFAPAAAALWLVLILKWLRAGRKASNASAGNHH